MIAKCLDQGQDQGLFQKIGKSIIMKRNTTMIIEDSKTITIKEIITINIVGKMVIIQITAINN